MAHATLRFPENINASGTYMVLTRYKSMGYTTEELRNINQTFLKTSPVASYGLPVPNELTDSSAINYTDIQDTDIANSLQVRTEQKFDTTAQMAKLATGTTTPLLATMLFNGVQAKSFQFSWDLIPETAAEANSISQIIQGLEEAKLPYFESFSFASRLKFPDVFHISFGGVQPKLIKYLICAITSIDVSYSDGHFQIYNDGNFPKLRLTIGFTELTARTREMQQALYKRAN